MEGDRKPSAAFTLRNEKGKPPMRRSKSLDDLSDGSIFYAKVVVKDEDYVKVVVQETSRVPPPSDYERQREKHLNKMKQICFTGLTKFGVPMPPGMVLRKSARWVIPIFKDLVVKERRLIETEHDNIKKKALITFVMMPMILLVIVGLSIWKPSYASLGIGLWFSIIHYLCCVIYLCWLKKKEQALEKYRVKIAEFVLEQRKKLPMVEVDSVEADQPANDLINAYCYNATIPLGCVLKNLIYVTALIGILGIGFCGHFYWSAHTLWIYTVAVNVISWISLGRCCYNLRRLPVESPPV